MNEELIKIGDKIFYSNDYGNDDVSNEEYDHAVKKWEQFKQYTGDEEWSKNRIRKEAVKWIKKDKEDILKENLIITSGYLLKRWMRRLNITEDDLEVTE